MINMVRRRAAAPVEEVFEEVDEIEELADPEDDLEELVEEAPKPAKRAKAPTKAAPAKATKATKAAPAKKAAEPSESSEYDSNWLAAYVTEETGVEYDSRGIRMLLRKLAQNGAFEREIGTDRSRYVFPKGANDGIVKQVIRMIKTGEAASVKREGLDTVKANAAAKKAAAPAKTAPAKKAAPAKTTRRRAAAE
jgi:hypothetical protein